MNVGQLALRGTIGPLFIGHGAQKLFGWFDGHGLEGTAGFFEGALGLRPGKRHATAAGVSELAGGVLLTAGALTPLASAAVTGTMVTAIRKAHAKNGIWTTAGGYEYNLVLIAAATALADFGPGTPSVDGARFPRLKGNAIALASLAAGIAGSYLVTEVFSDKAPAPQEGQADVPADPASAPPADAGTGDRTAGGRFSPQTAGETADTPATS
ncbi:MAG: putative oxidoreductase [Solirubrobacteraceae bacterium]|nr:putative oxidoreductase [Solirubrobacteraceae bacterium]